MPISTLLASPVPFDLADVLEVARLVATHTGLPPNIEVHTQGEDFQVDVVVNGVTVNVYTTSPSPARARQAGPFGLGMQKLTSRFNPVADENIQTTAYRPEWFYSLFVQALADRVGAQLFAEEALRPQLPEPDVIDTLDKFLAMFFPAPLVPRHGRILA